MSIEENIFKKTNIDFEKLLEYGFKKESEKYLYSKLILDGTFNIIVEIDNTCKISCKIIDLSFNEEYSNFKIENTSGEFTNKVRYEVEKVLKDIKDTCCKENYFIFNQSNRITKIIMDKYNDKPVFLWEKYPGYGVFKNQSNNKWYALIMNIKRNKIDNGNDEVEIINIKLKEEKVIELLDKKSFYKAYHMNKKNWISIILDDTLTDDEIISYVIESYALSNK